MDIAYQAPFMNGFFNILSILLGIAAIVFSIHSFQVSGCLICCTVSGGCCGGALLCQLLEVNRRVALGDWSALMDTMDTVILAAAGLLAVTVILNVLALLRGRNRKDPHCEKGC